MDLSLYKAAMEGNIGVLMKNKDRFEEQVTPTSNTVLHVTAQFNDNADNRGMDTPAPLKALIRFAKTQSRDPESGLEIIEQMVRTTCENKDTALHEAVRNNHLGVVELLVEEDKEFFIRCQQRRGDSALPCSRERLPRNCVLNLDNLYITGFQWPEW
ncbi:hypothetical protein Acr_03g0017730 [Actinidia rufa]|uniref:Ankyrin repeat family protein n=1 Tax=Actinidia rufa TaxID=165716 RepID=A0A7J0EGG5_9ERIC|nr:hypothetical protein Acr_03g0017730 [Actinidia rufa]